MSCHLASTKATSAMLGGIETEIQKYTLRHTHNTQKNIGWFGVIQKVAKILMACVELLLEKKFLMAGVQVLEIFVIAMPRGSRVEIK